MVAPENEHGVHAGKRGVALSDPAEQREAALREAIYEDCELVLAEPPWLGIASAVAGEGVVGIDLGTRRGIAVGFEEKEEQWKSQG